MKASARLHFARQLLEEPQHLRLGRNVEPGDDLVGEHEIRPQHDGARDADALALPAGKLVRSSGRPDAASRPTRSSTRVRPARAPPPRSCARPCSRSGSIRMRPIVCRGLSEDIGSWKIICMRRRSGRTRALVERGDVAAVEDDRAGRRRDEPEQRAAERGLAGAGLADDADGLAAADRDVDAVQHRRRGRAAAEQAAQAAAIGDDESARDQQIQPWPASAAAASKAAISARSAAITSGGIGSRPGIGPVVARVGGEKRLAYRRGAAR